MTGLPHPGPVGTATRPVGRVVFRPGIVRVVTGFGNEEVRVVTGFGNDDIKVVTGFGNDGSRALQDFWTDAEGRDKGSPMAVEAGGVIIPWGRSVAEAAPWPRNARARARTGCSSVWCPQNSSPELQQSASKVRILHAPDPAWESMVASDWVTDCDGALFRTDKGQLETPCLAPTFAAPELTCKAAKSGGESLGVFQERAVTAAEQGHPV